MALLFSGRGCLTQEKIVAGCAKHFIVIADFRWGVCVCVCVYKRCVWVVVRVFEIFGPSPKHTPQVSWVEMGLAWSECHPPLPWAPTCALINYTGLGVEHASQSVEKPMQTDPMLTSVVVQDTHASTFLKASAGRVINFSHAQLG